MADKPKGIKSFFKKYGVSYFMLSFWLIIFAVFVVVPVISSVALSFTNYDLLNLPKFTGIKNYTRMFLGDDVFIIALKNTVIFAVITGPLGYIMSFIFAWFISDLSNKVRPLYTLLFYAPTLAGNVYFVWIYIFSGDQYGILNSWLMRLGLIADPVQWLNDPRYNFGVVVIVVLWLSMGAGFLAFVAGFKQMNRTLFEASAVDGIRNRWQELYYVTLPQMGPQLMIGAVLSISGAFAVGLQCSMLTGLPSTEYSTHTLLLHMIDTGTYRYEMGYACAIAVVLFALMLVSWAAISRGLSKFSAD